MFAYIARRLVLAMLTVWMISVLAFVIIQLPQGDAVEKHLDRVLVDGTRHAINVEGQHYHAAGVARPDSTHRSPPGSEYTPFQGTIGQDRSGDNRRVWYSRRLTRPQGVPYPLGLHPRKLNDIDWRV